MSGHQQFFAGVEGGATSSRLVVFDESGKQLVETVTDSTNPYVVGFDVCGQRLDKLLREAAGILGMTTEDFSQRLCILGLALSGGAHHDSAERILGSLRKANPHLSGGHISVFNDTLGSLYTVFPQGGVVLISGTGSNCVLCTPESEVLSSGGWGHAIGDYGSAFWIATETIKRVIEAEDCYDRPGLAANKTLDASRLRSIVLTRFGVKSTCALMDHFYGPGFCKTAIASLTKEVGIAARDGDKMSLQIFNEAGRHLGAHIVGVIKRAKRDFGLAKTVDFIKRTSATSPCGLFPVLVVGSVWKSWDLLKQGFLDELSPHFKEEGFPDGFSLHMMCKCAAIGAAFLASREAGVPINLDFSQNATLLDKIENPHK